jgi:hypothetical protein
MSAPADRTEVAITVRLMGGLGNQLFQYAAARATALRLECPLYVDASNRSKAAQNKDSRNFALEWLVPPGDLVGGSHRMPGRLRRQLIHAVPQATPRGIFIESGFAYDPRLLDVQPGTTLFGYFQSWRYFADFATELRNEIVQAAPRSAWFDDTIDSLSSLGDWTAVHIRRGDYTTARNEAFHGLLGPQYYQRAIEATGECVPDGPVVVFSDDPQYALTILEDCRREVIVLHPPDQSHPMESIALMARASAVITANSSFSWWGAWLAGPSVSVVCPSDWFRGASHDEADLRPPPWTMAPSDFVAARG